MDRMSSLIFLWIAPTSYMRLKDGASLHELPAYYHAALLPPAGRALFSIRLASGLRSDFVAIEDLKEEAVEQKCRAYMQVWVQLAWD